MALLPPLILVYGAPVWGSHLHRVLPADADVHITIAWATGALMSYVADSYRRCCGCIVRDWPRIERFYRYHRSMLLAISRMLSTKIAAMSSHASEEDACPHSRRWAAFCSSCSGH